ncbi:MAG: PIN domain-containing protein [Treponema sp.]|nr:PIN domain-containing protein [Treponema sp.]
MKNMRILIDTNIILDLIQNRKPHSDNASKIINSCVKSENIGYISAHSLSDLFFILRKDKSVDERKALILNLCKFFKIVPEDKDFYISVCNNPDWNDLEDGLQMKCAEIEELDYIVTRDEKSGFKNSPVKIISPEEFLKIKK